MTGLPFSIGHVGTPPIKCQGIKTKLVPFILENIKWNWGREGRWIEPFLGSGVVAFNLAPRRALLADTNKHIIGLYEAIYARKLTSESVRDFLQQEGQRLEKSGVEYFKIVRERFNSDGSPLDLIFLSRSCFNGVMRFNSSGRFNVPFCHKPNRFSKSYITKIVNQVNWLARQMEGKEWDFKVCDWRESMAHAREADFVYMDPPYIARHTDYFNSWSDNEAVLLAKQARELPCGYALSMWLENKYRRNDHIAADWNGHTVRVFRHFYHVGSTEDLRNEMQEALVIKSGFASELPEKQRAESVRALEQQALGLI